RLGWKCESSVWSYALLMLTVLRERATKPAIEAKVLGTRISFTSWPVFMSEKSSWFRVSSAKIVQRSASTRSRILSLMSTRISWIEGAELIMLALSMSLFRYDSSRWVVSMVRGVAIARVLLGRKMPEITENFCGSRVSGRGGTVKEARPDV